MNYTDTQLDLLLDAVHAIDDYITDNGRPEGQEWRDTIALLYELRDNLLDDASEASEAGVSIQRICTVGAVVQSMLDEFDG